jgi:hypothetical protein
MLYQYINNNPISLAIAILMQVPQADLIGLWLAKGK